jgi:hypothetical protein
MKKRESIFINLLHKYTSIDSDFIKIFFSKFSIGDELEFHINDKDVSSYLNIDVTQLRDRLNNKYKKKYYIEHVDYIKVKTGVTSQVIYFLNYTCFEKIAMGCDSPNAFRVKEYFIQLREFIMKYGEIIQQSINNHEILKNSMLRKYDMIYFFVVDKRYKDIIKIGTTSNIIERIKSYNTGRIDEVDIKYASIVYDGKTIEKCIKNSEIMKQSEYYKGREIYNITEKLLLDVIKSCYNKCTTSSNHKKIYKDMSTILDLYDFIQNNKHMQPYVIIPLSK